MGLADTRRGVSYRVVCDVATSSSASRPACPEQTMSNRARRQDGMATTRFQLQKLPLHSITAHDSTPYGYNLLWLIGGEPMLFAVIGSSTGKSRDEIMAIYPRHKALLDQFVARGEVVGVGPFTDPGGGNMALFRSRAAAEAFAKSDPFLLEGAIREYQVKEWGDTMLS
jgi:uncharacterized protein